MFGYGIDLNEVITAMACDQPSCTYLRVLGVLVFATLLAFFVGIIIPIVFDIVVWFLHATTDVIRTYFTLFSFLFTHPKTKEKKIKLINKK